MFLTGDLGDLFITQRFPPQLPPGKLQEGIPRPHNVIVEPDRSLFSPDGVVVTHDDVSQSQTVRFQEGKHPTQKYDRG